MGHTSNTVSIHDRAAEFGRAAETLAHAVPDSHERSRYYPTGHSARMEHVRRTIGEVAGSLLPVLITGERGAGKEWAARYIHAQSPRADQPFVSVDCAAIPADELDLELFGRARDADAGPARQSRIEAAQGGTLFIDEISAIDPALFAKLLTSLRQRSYRRVGGNRARPCDVRLIASGVGQGASDALKELFYGAPAAHLEMPPLRKRPEDLDDLVEDLMSRAEEHGMAPARLTSGAMRILRHYDWPGNVRELAGLVERLSLLYPGREVDIADLPVQFTENVPLRMDDRLGIVARRADGPRPQDIDLSTGRVHLKQYLEDIEVALIRRALRESGGVIAHAAKYLHLRRTTLAEKIKRYGLRDDTAE